MKTSGLNFLLLGMLCSTPVFAGSLLDRLSKEDVQKYAKQLQLKKGNLKAKSNQCTNFAGKWEGTCTYSNGRTEAEDLEIKQDSCYTVEMHTLPVPVFGLYSVHQTVYPFATDFNFNVSGTFSRSWNEAQTELKSLASIHLGDRLYTELERMWIDGDVLRTQNIEHHEIEIESSGGNFITKMSCQYNRVP